MDMKYISQAIFPRNILNLVGAITPVIDKMETLLAYHLSEWK